MSFNSLDFLLFLLIVIPVHFLTPVRWRWLWLLAVSFFFYMYWKPWYILLLLFSILIDYVAALKIAGTTEARRRKLWLTLSLTSNLGMLLFFKYLFFFSESLNDVLQLSGQAYTVPGWDILLPVGISFYTFQSMSYSIDVYRGMLAPEKHFGKFALYVSFFPQLVAGPIERAGHLLPQLRSNKKPFRYDLFVSGFTQMMIGFFKKVVVADQLALYVDAVYGHSEFHSAGTLLLATLFFSFQIYCDFSGYSDIAIGVARIMGYDFRENFNLPYLSASVTEFWRRWHISFSTWLRDYLYIPLGGNRRGKFRTYVNLLLTMLLGGLWHGANWTFVIWGGLNGLLLAFEKLTGINKKPRNSVQKLLQILLTFTLISFTRVFVRSSSLQEAWSIVSRIFTSLFPLRVNLLNTYLFVSAVAALLLLVLIEVFLARQKPVREWQLQNRTVSAVGFNLVLFLVIVWFGVSAGNQFIYFQF